MTLPRHLWEIKENIRKIAEAYGLECFETIFEIVDYKRINEIAAYGGFPTRYPHWRFGMEYEQLAKSYTYGLSKIYEMVINNDPCYAYLLEGNNLVDQKTVIAHVYGHCDFFKNNYYFSKTNRKMMDEMANHATRVRRYIDRYGVEKIESFIDVCLSIDNLIDHHAPFIVRKREDDEQEQPIEVPRLRSKDYMDKYINPPEYLEEQRKKLEAEREKSRKFPRTPTKDVMAFLLENAPLEGWEADILSVIREEAYYFAPQGMTKIMNEGWACVTADTLVFTDRGLVPMSALVDSGTGEVFDGQRRQQVYDRNIIRDQATVRVQTRRGLVLCGSTNHRVLLEDGSTWRRLDELKPGDHVSVSGGGGMWGTRPASDIPWDADALNALKGVPVDILCAPEPHVRVFLSALYDHHGEVDADGIALSSSSETLSRQVQLLLLNYGLLSRRRLQKDGCWHVHVCGASARDFATLIGFGLERKQQALEAYVQAHQQFKRERWTDEVVTLEPGQADVYDISVTDTHRYAAAGLVNHNSFWHSRIMTQKVLQPDEIIDYAEAYAGVVAVQPGGFNPYKIGIELFRTVEERWNKGQFGKDWEECDNIADKESWDKKLGLGMEKIFQIRSIYNDVTFIDEFLTEDFAREHKLFTFGFNRKAREWQIESREFKQVKEKLLNQLTNFGNPYIFVRDGNFHNRAELLLHHRYDGTELRLDYARDVLQNIFRIWKRPVNIETVIDGKGRLFTFDGRDHSDKAAEYIPL